MKMKRKLARYFGFAAGPKFRMAVAIVLVVSAGSEVLKDIHELFGSGEFSLGAHHGVFLWGVMHLFRQLADLGEDVGLAAEGLIVMDESEMSEATASNPTVFRDPSS